jgi:hypothetical protein
MQAPVATVLQMVSGTLQGASTASRPFGRFGIEEERMYIRITTGRFDASRANEIEQLVAQAVGNAARALPGFKSYSTGLDRQAGRFAAISTWETEDQARGFRDQLSQDVMQQMKNAGVQLDEGQVYEAVGSV